jgi:CRP-like cAMP-binding protein
MPRWFTTQLKFFCTDGRVFAKTALPDDLFGLIETFSGNSCEVSAQTMEISVIKTILCDDFFSFTKHYGQTSSNVTKILSVSYKGAFFDTPDPALPSL